MFCSFSLFIFFWLRGRDRTEAESEAEQPRAISSSRAWPLPNSLLPTKGRKQRKGHQQFQLHHRQHQNKHKHKRLPDCGINICICTHLDECPRMGLSIALGSY
ncbi:hypothetical protein SUGI_0969710 [Cryptomeria japonica]|nr:hypothetical protein SUGI_0969710 [Cryptomeria japonica]